MAVWNRFTKALPVCSSSRSAPVRVNVLQGCWKVRWNDRRVLAFRASGSNQSGLEVGEKIESSDRRMMVREGKTETEMDGSMDGFVGVCSSIFRGKIVNPRALPTTIWY